MKKMIINKIWGKKVGMTHVFTPDNYQSIPVTVIDIGRWYILQKKVKSKEGYDSLQVGFLRTKYRTKDFSLEWLKDKKQYFLYVREIRLADEKNTYNVGDVFSSEGLFAEGDKIKVAGLTVGKGFQGVVKRYGFTGGRGSHGDKLGRRPGSLCGLRTQGMVFKGKKMPGHDGVESKTISNLKIIKIQNDSSIFLVKGAIPGKSGSLVCMIKQEIR